MASASRKAAIQNAMPAITLMALALTRGFAAGLHRSGTESTTPVGDEPRRKRRQPSGAHGIALGLLHCPHRKATLHSLAP
jgi:hypothetical protein